MAKYNYDKSLLKGLSVAPFLHEVEERNKHIEAANTTRPKSVFNANKIASELHPHMQFVQVNKVTQTGDGFLYELVPDKTNGTNELAYFRAGQYIALPFKLANGTTTTRDYTICSSPKEALGKDSKYRILVCPVQGGAVSNEIVEN